MKKFKIIIEIIIVIVLIVSSLHNLHAQVESTGQSMIVSNSLDSINPHIKIKWFIPKIYSPKGVNIYRRGPGQQNWERILDKPFKKGDYSIPVEEFDKDTTLERFVSLIDGLSENEMQGLTLAMILIKSIQSQVYAQYIGVEYHDIDVKFGDQYQYKVSKITSSGEKDIGVSQIITVKKHKRHNPPEDIEIKAGDEQVLIKWKPNKFRFYGVNVYRRSDDQNDFLKMNDVPLITSKRKGPDGVLAYADIFYTDDSLSNGTTYYYKIVGLDYFNRNSKFSETFEVTPKDETAPPAPKFLRNKVDLLNVFLNWENVYVPDLKGLQIYRSIHYDRDFIQINEKMLNRDVNGYVDAVEKPGKYYYYVSAIDSSGNQGSSFLTMANVLDIYPPEKPKGLYTESDTGRIILNWLPNNEEDLMGYQIFRTVDRDNKKRYVLLNANPIADTTYIDTLPISAKNKFHYRIAAIDSSINRSEYSDFAASTMPDVIAPAQPFIKDIIITENNYLQIHWIPNVDLDLMGYSIFRENANDSLTKKGKLNESLLSPLVKHFTDRWVEQGTKYNYYLEAVDSSGNKSEFSNPFPGKLPNLKPEIGDKVIKYLNVKNKGNYIQIKWEINPEDDFLGTIVYRKEEGEAFTPLTGLMQGNKFKDNDITPGSIYYYEVRIYHESYGESRSKVEKMVVPTDDHE
ncbi:MAG: hypothetical protein PF485_14965 [Bacteroidales bacterium]|jgi:fibronectin type 3 domain-containing protein|nr:hypothetical protein [Bacteroidales bacterium]